MFCPPRMLLPGVGRAVLPVPGRAARLRAGRAEGVLLAAARAAARRARAAGRDVGGRGRQPHAGPRAGALDELGAGQPRHDPARPRRRRRVAGVGAAQRRACRRAHVHPLPSRRARARRAAGAGAVLDAARVGRAVARARPGRERGHALAPRRGARSRSAGCRPRTPPCSARWRRSRSRRCGRSRTTSKDPALLPQGEAARWFILDCIRRARPRRASSAGVSPKAVNRFLRSLPHEHQLNVADRPGRSLGRARRRRRDAGAAEEGGRRCEARPRRRGRARASARFGW